MRLPSPAATSRMIQQPAVVFRKVGEESYLHIGTQGEEDAHQDDELARLQRAREEAKTMSAAQKQEEETRQVKGDLRSHYDPCRWQVIGCDRWLLLRLDIKATARPCLPALQVSHVWIAMGFASLCKQIL